MTSIVRIEAAGPGPRARRLVFDEGIEPRTTSKAVVRALELEEGQTIDPTDLIARLAEVEPEAAKERALRLLGYRERSQAEVMRALKDDGYPTAVTAPIVDRLCELGLIDDLRFAEMWARSRAASGFGSRRVGRELSEKGIDRDTASRALAEAFNEDDSLDQARRIVAGRPTATRKDRDKLIRRIVAKGFDMGTALRVVKELEVGHDEY